MATFAVSAYASTTMGNWRWRKDNGSETSATWIAAQNQEITINSNTEHLRLRIELDNDYGEPVDIGTSYLEYSGDGGLTWDSITNYAGTKAFVLAGTSANVTDGTPTTRQLTEVAGFTFMQGLMIVSSDFLPSFMMDINNSTEFEWVIKPTSNLKPNTTYVFDVYPQNLSTVIPPPSLKTAATLPIVLIDFTVQSLGDKVKLQWTTSSEQNNDHFIAERSADGKSNWQQVAMVRGNGTTGVAHHYTAYDNAPLNGKNYYRIKQVDTDGSGMESDIRAITMQQVKGVLHAYPNPNKGEFYINLNGYSGLLHVRILDMNGKVVYATNITANGFSAGYPVRIPQKPAPGTYMVQVEGDGIHLTRNMIIQ